MKNTSQLNLNDLISGKKVQCLTCKKGYYKPYNPDAKRNSYYICDKCGDTVHIDPVVEVE